MCSVFFSCSCVFTSAFWQSKHIFRGNSMEFCKAKKKQPNISDFSPIIDFSRRNSRDELQPFILGFNHVQSNIRNKDDIEVKHNHCNMKSKGYGNPFLEFKVFTLNKIASKTELKSLQDITGQFLRHFH